MYQVGRYWIRGIGVEFDLGEVVDVSLIVISRDSR